MKPNLFPKECMSQCRGLALFGGSIHNFYSRAMTIFKNAFLSRAAHSFQKSMGDHKFDPHGANIFWGSS